jgi:hypothetical protein
MVRCLYNAFLIVMFKINRIVKIARFLGGMMAPVGEFYFGTMRSQYLSTASG